MKRSAALPNRRCSTSSSSAPATRHARSWRKLFSIAPAAAISARFRPAVTPRDEFIPSRSTCCANLISTSAVCIPKLERIREAGVPKLDFVFTVCDDAANSRCPLWPGQPMTAHSGIPDPAAVEGTEVEQRLAFADAPRMLTNRINIFVSLPMRSLSGLALQTRLDAIGKSKNSSSNPASAA